MKPYAAEVSFTMIVMAENENDAEEIAISEADDAWRDVPEKDYWATGPIRTEADLNLHGWDGHSIPYGGDGETRLSDILAAIEPEPERDDRTIDMFGEAK